MMIFSVLLNNGKKLFEFIDQYFVVSAYDTMPGASL